MMPATEIPEAMVSGQPKFFVATATIGAFALASQVSLSFTHKKPPKKGMIIVSFRSYQSAP